MTTKKEELLDLIKRVWKGIGRILFILLSIVVTIVILLIIVVVELFELEED